ncbi:hypothetical protein SAMN05421759_103145 [Roseivivax lentus]|uniref:Amine oxidase domain-containing protein n=1 Tax=Roseivivax lentus TaxID=633194 RepID=A0A1N7LTH4_9RHOB|nr:FAD-dependent oxidoreductase [Roseivivax lentus]SIS77153.1 hypothetical protein SAMN05421759_103145 [Roseivivax lentus]
MTSVPRIAVIGAGMAGLSCARSLADRGLSVVVFDKGRGIGGRMATRRAEPGFQFDHGAQYLRARGEAFATLLSEAEAAGAVARWPLPGRDAAYVGLPGMTGLPKYLGRGIEIRQGVQVDRVVPVGDGWKLVWNGGDAPFDRVVITAPAPQIAALLPEGHAFAEVLTGVEMAPCLTLMAGLPQGAEMPFTHRRAPEEDISWIACDQTKPGRPGAVCLVAQAGLDWSLRHLELDRDEIAAAMLPAVSAALGRDLARDAAYVSAHRWRYAFVAVPLGAPFLADNAQGLFAGGDWCLGAKAEDAWTSGRAVAEAVLRGL